MSLSRRFLLALPLAVMTTTACDGLDCTAMSAPSRATIDRPVSTAFDASKPLHVELCRNDDCTAGDFSIGDDARLCRTTETLEDDNCKLLRAADGSWRFTASWVEKTGDFRNGDRYRATLSSAGVPLVTVDARATYSESEPNGEGCGITKTATL